jgi:Permeases of the drug/metabolite transporter (DMT) superfamily
MSNKTTTPREWSKLTIYTAIILSMVFWSFSYVWTNIALRSFTVITLLESRLLVATVVMFLFGIFTRQLQLPRREDIKWFLLLAFFEPFLYFIGETYGLKRISPTIASVMIATIPLFAPFSAYFILKEKISKSNIAGIIVSFAGIVSIVTVGSDQATATDTAGVLLIALAVASAIFYATVLKKLSAHYNGVTLVTYQNIIGFFYFLPLFLGIEAPHLHEIVWRTDSIVCMLLLALFASFIAFVLFAEAVRRIGVARSNVFCNLLPVLTAIFSAIILHEVLPAQQIIGMVVVIAGLFVSQINKRVRR